MEEKKLEEILHAVINEMQGGSISGEIEWDTCIEAMKRAVKGAGENGGGYIATSLHNKIVAEQQEIVKQAQHLVKVDEEECGFIGVKWHNKIVESLEARASKAEKELAENESERLGLEKEEGGDDQKEYDVVRNFCKENNIDCSWDFNPRNGYWNEINFEGKLLMQITQGITVDQFKNVIKILSDNFYATEFPDDGIDFTVCMIQNSEFEKLFAKFIKKYENVFNKI